MEQYAAVYQETYGYKRETRSFIILSSINIKMSGWFCETSFWFNRQLVAAPDHKIRQCIQRSALFLGRADGGTEGPGRSAGAARGWGLVGAP